MGWNEKVLGGEAIGLEVFNELPKRLDPDRDVTFTRQDGSRITFWWRGEGVYEELWEITRSPEEASEVFINRALAGLFETTDAIVVYAWGNFSNAPAVAKAKLKHGVGDLIPVGEAGEFIDLVTVVTWARAYGLKEARKLLGHRSDIVRYLKA